MKFHRSVRPNRELRLHRFMLLGLASLIIFSVHAGRLSGSRDIPSISAVFWQQNPPILASTQWFIYRTSYDGQPEGWMVVRWYREPLPESPYTVAFWTWPSLNATPHFFAQIQWQPATKRFLATPTLRGSSYWPWAVVRSLPVAWNHTLMPATHGWNFTISLVPGMDGARSSTTRHIRAWHGPSIARADTIWDFWIENKPAGKIILARLNGIRDFQLIRQWSDPEWNITVISQQR